MSAGSVRDGRRRRVLNEGARSASAAFLENSDPNTGDSSVPKRRFAPEEGSVSYAVARGLLPLQAVPFTLVLIGVLLLTTGVLAGDYYHARLGVMWQGVLRLDATTSLGRWFVTTLLLANGAMCLVLFGLRSSRTDDVRGQYRWWFSAGVGCLLASALYAIQLPQTGGASLSALTGIGPLGGTLWWLAPALLAGLVLSLRPVKDFIDSKLSLSFVLLAALALTASTAATVDLMPAAWLVPRSLASHGGLLLGLVFSLAAMLAYARRVLLEADGVIAAPIKTSGPKKVKQQPKAPTVAKERVEPQQPKQQPAAAAQTQAAKEPQTAAKPKIADQTRWTDGSDGGAGEDNDGNPRRKLSKAERKRLRKQKAGRYAA